MFLDNVTFLNKVKNLQTNENEKTIILTEVFSDYLVDGKLQLQGIDFYRMGQWLHKIDFSNCEISQCNFSGTLLTDNNFKNSQITEDNLIENMVIQQESNEGLAFLPSQWQSKVIPKDTTWEYRSLYYQAQHAWINQLWDKNPEELFLYDKLQYRSFEFNRYIREMSEWFIFTHPKLISPLAHESKEDTDFLGWKLHLSVNPDDITHAFHLIAPLISRYCPTFKVINVERINGDTDHIHANFDDDTDDEDKEHYLQMEKKYPIKANTLTLLKEFNQDLLKRGRKGMQFAIYLQQKGTILVSPENAKKMLAEVTSTLLAANISPGVIPCSDMKTTSPYFSMRNDLVMIWNFERFERRYFSAEESYRNPNPGNHENIFSNLLEENHSFDLLRHFESLPPFMSINELVENLGYSLLAFLREYTIIDSFNLEEINNFEDACEKISSPELANHFLKKEYYDDITIKSMVKRAGLLINYLKHREFKEPQDFLLQYPNQDIFSDSMIKITARINEFLLEEDAYKKENPPEFEWGTPRYENFDVYINQVMEWEKYEKYDFYELPDAVDLEPNYNFSANDSSEKEDTGSVSIMQFTQLLQQHQSHPIFGQPHRPEVEELVEIDDKRRLI